MRGVFLAGLLAGASLLSGCADDGGSGDDLLIIVGGGPGNYNCESDDSVLDGAQCSVTELVDDLAAIFNDTPLEDFIQCIDPLANDLIEGPDSVLNTILTALAEQSASPEEMQQAIMDLASPFMSIAGVAEIKLPALGSASDVESLNKVIAQLDDVVKTIQQIVDGLGGCPS